MTDDTKNLMERVNRLATKQRTPEVVATKPVSGKFHRSMRDIALTEWAKEHGLVWYDPDYSDDPAFTIAHIISPRAKDDDIDSDNIIDLKSLPNDPFIPITITTTQPRRDTNG